MASTSYKLKCSAQNNFKKFLYLLEVQVVTRKFQKYSKECIMLGEKVSADTCQRFWN